MPVSAATETKLREAMARLLAGEPLHTDGALTKENLAREAKVSHATVHRAEDVLAEWNARVRPSRAAYAGRGPTRRSDCRPEGQVARGQGEGDQAAGQARRARHGDREPL